MRYAGGMVSIVSFCGMILAQDVRDKVKDENETGLTSAEIDPDKHIFGVPLGTTEDDLIRRFGKPDGYIRFSGNASGMIYGKEVAFLFEQKKLSGVRLDSHSILDHRLSSRMPSHPAFSGIPWKTNNGIRNGLSLKELKEMLGEKLSGDKYNRFYTTEFAVIHIDLVQHMNLGEGDEAYKVSGINLERK